MKIKKRKVTRNLTRRVTGDAQEEMKIFWRLVQVLTTVTNLQRRMTHALAIVITTLENANMRIGQ